MRVKNEFYWISASLAFILILGNILPISYYCDSNLLFGESISEPEEKGILLAGTPHAPIAIDGDINFSDTASAEGWLGDGSSGNPYIIDGLDIDSNGTGGHCISINNTRVNFTIQNCYLTGANMSYGAGIFMENVTNGKLIGNTIYNNVFNIYLAEAHAFLIMNNIAFDSDWSIGLHDSSSNNTIAENNCSYNIWAGIFLGYSSNNNTVINNVCDDNVYGVEVYQSAYNTVIGNDCKNNLFFGVLITNSTYNVVTDNIISNSSRGIYLSTESMHNTVANNTCSGNSNSGILVSTSDFNTVVGNKLTNNSHGIDLDFSESNTVSNNTSTNNTNVGISLFFSFTTDVHWNVFANNPTNGLEESGIDNVFDYNYWSDYTGNDSNSDGFGDTPYAFTGNSDPHPLVYIPFAPVWLQHPVDQVIEFGNVFEYTLEYMTTAQTAPYEVSVDDLVNFVLINNETIISSSTLPVGVYPLQIEILNIYGYMTEGAFTLIVEDTTAPLITSPEDITYTEGEGAHEIAWTMSDLSTLSYRVLLNGTELTSSTEPTTSTSFSMTLEDMDTSVYNYSIVAEDFWGNIAIDTVIVTVLPIPLLEPLLPWLIVGAVAVVVFVVIIFILQKRKSS